MCSAAEKGLYTYIYTHTCNIYIEKLGEFILMEKCVIIFIWLEYEIQKRASFEIHLGLDTWLSLQTEPKIRYNPDILREETQAERPDYVSAYSEAYYVSHSYMFWVKQYDLDG